METIGSLETHPVLLPGGRASPGSRSERLRRGLVHMLLLALALALSLPAWAGEAATRVVAGVPARFPPHYSLESDTGRPTGFAIEIMDALSDRAGLQVEYRVFPGWTEVLEALRTGEIDLIPNLGITEERKAFADFTNPVETFPIVIFVRRASTDIRGIDDLEGRKVSVVKKNVGVRLMRDAEGVQIVVHELPSAALLHLLSGRSDAIVYPAPVLQRILHKAGLSDRVKVVGSPLLEVKRAVAVGKGKGELLSALQGAIDAFIPSDEYQRIYTEWYGRPPPFWTPMRVALGMGALLLVSVLVVGLWRYRSTVRLNKALTASVTQREQAEAHIRHLNAVLRAIRNVNHLITTEKDRDRLIQAVPEKLTDTRGYERAALVLLDGEEEVLAATASAADSQADSIVEGLKNKPLPACAAKALAASAPVLTASPDPICRECPMLDREDAGTCLTMRLEHAGGVYGLLFARLRPGFTEDPEERQLFAEAAQDVGLALYTMDQEEAHARSRADVARLARFPNENPNPVLRVSRDGQIQYANGASVLLLDFWKRSEGQKLPEDWLGVARESLQEEEIVQREIECGERIFSLVFAPVDREDYVNIYGYEITRQKWLEGKLRQAEKMQAIGQLAGGIAHEFNNQIAVINGFAELGMRKLDKDSRLHGQLEQILAAGQRAGELTSQLLAYSREQVIQPEVLNLNKAVQSVRAMLNRVIGEDIQIKFDLAQDLGATKVDRGQFSDVILNLVSNARDAMPKGGTILISTQNVQLHEKEIAEEKDLQPGPYVEIAVSDTGVGMDEETRSRVFEPFFTTKEVGRGTGLGLAMVAGVVQGAGGAVSVYSEPGQGTAIKLLLPRVEGEGESIAPEIVAEEELPGGAETLLVVEDEGRVRCLLVSLLEEVGYRVIEANSGKDALRMAAEQPGDIDLLITDLVMPGMTGRELAERFRSLSPGAKVLYASGYGRDQISERGILEPGLPFVQKPFRTVDLLRKVRSLLDEAASAVGGERAADREGS